MPNQIRHRAKMHNEKLGKINTTISKIVHDELKTRVPPLEDLIKQSEELSAQGNSLFFSAPSQAITSHSRRPSPILRHTQSQSLRDLPSSKIIQDIMSGNVKKYEHKSEQDYRNLERVCFLAIIFMMTVIIGHLVHLNNSETLNSCKLNPT